MDITTIIEEIEIANTYVSRLILSAGDLTHVIEAHYIYVEDKQDPILVFLKDAKLNVTVTFRLSKECSLLWNPRHQHIQCTGGAIFKGKLVSQIISWLEGIGKNIPHGKVFEPYTLITSRELALQEMIKSKRIHVSPFDPV